LEKLCHPGLGAELGGEEVAGSCANATIDAASRPHAMQQATVRIVLVGMYLIDKLLSIFHNLVRHLPFQTPHYRYLVEKKGSDLICCSP
jgi:hypothetical protein